MCIDLDDESKEPIKLVDAKNTAVLMRKYLKKTTDESSLETEHDIYHLGLDSSRADKTSYHLFFRILNLKNKAEVLFPDILACGKLVRLFKHEVKIELSKIPDGEPGKIMHVDFSATDIEGLRKMFLRPNVIDERIYSRNRCLRLYLSSKRHSPSVVLKYCEELTDPPLSPNHLRILRISMATQPVSSKTEILDCSSIINSLSSLERSRTASNVLIPAKSKKNKIEPTNRSLPCPEKLKVYFQRFVQGEGYVTAIRKDRYENEYSVNTTSHTCCYREKGYHVNNHSFLIVNTRLKSIGHSCYHYECKKRTRVILPELLDEDICRQIEELFSEEKILPTRDSSKIIESAIDCSQATKSSDTENRASIIDEDGKELYFDSSDWLTQTP